MSRLFDGVDDQMVYSFSSSLAASGPKTLLMVLRIMNATDLAWLSFMEWENASSVDVAALGRRNNGNIYTVKGGTTFDNIAVQDADDWVVIATTWPAASAVPRHHKDVIGGAATHTDGAGVANSPFSDNIPTVRLGGNADFCNMRLAAAAIFTSELSDVDIESVENAKTTQSIADLSPFWLVDDSDAFATNLITPGTGDRSSITGTADDADDPAGWVYGLGAAPPAASMPPDFQRNLFPFAPLRDHPQIGRGRPGRITPMDEMRGSGPHPAGAFERALLRRSHPVIVAGQTLEIVGAVDSSSAGILGRARSITGAVETDTAATPTAVHSRALTGATEIDTAATPLRAKRPVGATETDTAATLTRAKRRTITGAAETDTAATVATRKTRTVTGAAETDTAGTLGRAKTRAVAGATTTAAAATFGRAKAKQIGGAAEADTAGVPTAVTGGSLSPAIETDTAGTFGRAKRKTIVGAAEAVSAGTLGRVKRRLLTGASETNTAAPLGRGHASALTGATQTSTAGTIAHSKRTAVTGAAETDTAGVVISLSSASLPGMRIAYVRVIRPDAHVRRHGPDGQVHRLAAESALRRV